jgi:transcription elongation factor SPT6
VRGASHSTHISHTSLSAWQEIFEVFGDGTDYDWALGDDEQIMEQVKTETSYTDVRLLIIFVFLASY